MQKVYLRRPDGGIVEGRLLGDGQHWQIYPAGGAPRLAYDHEFTGWYPALGR